MILITGASGNVGREVLKQIIESGHRARAAYQFHQFLDRGDKQRLSRSPLQRTRVRKRWTEHRICPPLRPAAYWAGTVLSFRPFNARK
jgi:nucleoside-diphosphate-sugar epimerase